MSFADERQAFETRFAAGFTALPIKFQNVPFVQPATPWVAFHVKPGEGRQVSTNSRPLYRYAGIVQIDINVPEQSGTAAARGYADTIEALFRNVQFSAGSSGTITCRAPYITDRGVVDGWYVLSVTVPYQRDKIF